GSWPGSRFAGWIGHSYLKRLRREPKQLRLKSKSSEQEREKGDLMMRINGYCKGGKCNKYTEACVLMPQAQSNTKPAASLTWQRMNASSTSLCRRTSFQQSANNKSYSPAIS